MRRLLLGAGVLALLVAGCTAAAHLKVLQPPAAPSSPPITMPAAAVVARPSPGHFPQLGIDIDLYTYPGQDFAAAAEEGGDRPQRRMSPTSPACTPMRCRSRSPSSWPAPMRRAYMPPAQPHRLTSSRSWCMTLSRPGCMCPSDRCLTRVTSGSPGPDGSPPTRLPGSPATGAS
jgi:hypothetical protein